MLFEYQYSARQTVSAGAVLTLGELRDFRARVGLALAASDYVVVDLTQTRRLDSWTLSALVDLAGTYESRLAFAAPPYLRKALVDLKTCVDDRG
jgi:anti-anti-sigma regulatory factor